MNKKLYAFWKYDCYPYLLGAPVVEFRDDGFITAEGYRGCRFKPIKILPLEAGKALKAKLDALEQEYNEQQRALHETFRKRARETFGEVYDG